MATELMLTGEEWLGLVECANNPPPRPFEREIHLMDAPIVGLTCLERHETWTDKLVPGVPLKLFVETDWDGKETVSVDSDDGGRCSTPIGCLSRRWGEVAVRLMKAGKKLTATLAKREGLPNGWVHLEARIMMKEA